MSVSMSRIQVSPEITIQPPLSRQGTGPGLILVIDADLDLSRHDKTLDPPPLKKWAEESYAVAQVLVGQDEDAFAKIPDQLSVAVEGLKKLAECSSYDRVGVVVIHGSLSLTAASAIQTHACVAALVFHGHYPFDPASPSPVPVLAHLPPPIPSPTPSNTKIHTYPSLQTPYFTIPSHPSYSASTSSVSHTRTLAFLKPLLDGPFFDLEAIWDEHTRYEFADRSVEDTMATMVDEPYVNHVPTLTGGVGRASLTRFYRDHFIFSNPGDARLELVSRTVGVDRVVDEFLFECTHDGMVDWLIPGIPPTGRQLRVPMTSIVNIRGDRLYHEHIAWDQGTVLRQLGLLPEYLPFPYPLDGTGNDDKRAAAAKLFEYRVPVAGVETARKLVDEASEPSNRLLEFQIREVS